MILICENNAKFSNVRLFLSFWIPSFYLANFVSKHRTLEIIFSVFREMINKISNYTIHKYQNKWILIKNSAYGSLSLAHICPPKYRMFWMNREIQFRLCVNKSSLSVIVVFDFQPAQIPPAVSNSNWKRPTFTRNCNCLIHKFTQLRDAMML